MFILINLRKIRRPCFEFSVAEQAALKLVFTRHNCLLLRRFICSITALTESNMNIPGTVTVKAWHTIVCIFFVKFIYVLMALLTCLTVLINKFKCLVLIISIPPVRPVQPVTFRFKYCMNNQEYYYESCNNRKDLYYM